jgi:hypothetical protein
MQNQIRKKHMQNSTQSQSTRRTRVRTASSQLTSVPPFRCFFSSALSTQHSARGFVILVPVGQAGHLAHIVGS